MGRVGWVGWYIPLKRMCFFIVEIFKVLTKINNRVCPLKYKQKNMTGFFIIVKV